MGAEEGRDVAGTVEEMDWVARERDFFAVTLAMTSRLVSFVEGAIFGFQGEPFADAFLTGWFPFALFVVVAEVLEEILLFSFFNTEERVALVPPAAFFIFFHLSGLSAVILVTLLLELICNIIIPSSAAFPPEEVPLSVFPAAPVESSNFAAEEFNFCVGGFFFG